MGQGAMLKFLCWRRSEKLRTLTWQRESITAAQDVSFSNNYSTINTYPTMMKTYLLFFWFPTACAFRAALVRPSRPCFTKLNLYPEKFERAIQCSTHFGLCDADELIELAEELESYQGSFFEKDDELRAKEASDRKDIADVLRKEAELKLRLDYVKNGNLFKEDVEEAATLKRRDEYLDAMDAYSEY